MSCNSGKGPAELLGGQKLLPLEFGKHVLKWVTMCGISINEYHGFALALLIYINGIC